LFEKGASGPGGGFFAGCQVRVHVHAPWGVAVRVPGSGNRHATCGVGVRIGLSDVMLDFRSSTSTCR
jgi:hypothetical protein